MEDVLNGICSQICDESSQIMHDTASKEQLDKVRDEYRGIFANLIEVIGKERAAV